MNADAWNAKHPKMNEYRSAIAWEAIHQSRMWGVWPDIHVVRQVKKFSSQWNQPTVAAALDIGCGVGACSLLMNENNMRVTSFDGSVTAVKRMAEAGWRAMVADAQTVDFPAESFDFILDNLSLTYLEHPPWERIMSWLKPGGWLIHASFEEAPKGTPKAWHHLSPGHVVERHTSWVEGNAFSFVVRKYVKEKV